MQTLIDFDAAPVVAIPVRDQVRPGPVHEAVLVEGPQGWGEFSPASDDDALTLARWLTAATEAGTVGWPDPLRGRIPVAVTVPAVTAETAYDVVVASQCRTAAVEVGAAGSVGGDIERLQAVRDALGPTGTIRCRAGGRWHADAAVTAIAELDRAAGGLEFVAQPSPSLEEIAEVRRRVDVRIAAQPADPSAELPLREAADIVLLSTGPLGGARRALRVAERTELPCVVTAGPQTTIGLGAGLALAGALPELPFACELGGVALLVEDVVAASRSLRPVGGFLPVAPMPPAPQAALVARYAVTDPARLAWWRTRIRAVAESV